MPPKRVTRATKASKENECVLKSGKTNYRDKSAKPRKALADKTNSASGSDDNTSFTQNNIPDKKVKKLLLNTSIENDCRPRRNRKLPTRYKENVMLNNLSNIEERSPSKQIKADKKTEPPKDLNFAVGNKKVISPIKSPIKEVDSSLLQNRPKRISRLPNKFDDHSISPNKPIPVQPISTSTPLVNKAKLVSKKQSKITKNASQKAQPSKKVSKQNIIDKYLSNKAADTNNNAKQKKKSRISPQKSPASTSKVNTNIVRIQNKVLDKKSNLKRDSSNLDIYEFTYDPAEEPPPAKKKKKRQVTKKPSKPKTITIKSNYDKNLAKALADLKNAVTLKFTTDKKDTNVICKENHEIAKQKLDQSDYVCNDKNYNSVRVEDIAMDMQENDIDYSPVNSPKPMTPKNDGNSEKQDAFNVKEISFFDENPVASSSMNMSHPMASPWRVNFENLPIKWPVNSYVKPNMTPAFESSFINFNDKKKHVYTNIVETNKPDVDSPNLKQTSIMSFIKEVVDKSTKKKKSTPVKANSLFEDTNMSIANQTPNKEIENANVTPLKESSSTSNISEKSIEHNMVHPKENDQAVKNNTYFGFDQSEDQENISPKKKDKARLLRSRSRGILQELNVQKGPMRAVIPVNTKSKGQDEVNKLFNDMNLANEPPVLRNEPTLTPNLDKDDSESVHLFEDIEVIHHLKPTRKSYGKAKKVAFANSVDSDSPLSDLADLNPGSSDEDESFQLPSMKPKKTVKKKKVDKLKLSKKEEKEVEAWAAGFNSMCEDIDEFDLLVE